MDICESSAADIASRVYRRENLLSNVIVAYMTYTSHDSAQYSHQSIDHLCYMSCNLKDIIDTVIRRNGFYGHLEIILILMLADDRTHIRQLALRRNLKPREFKWSTANTTIPMNDVCIFSLQYLFLMRHINNDLHGVMMPRNFIKLMIKW